MSEHALARRRANRRPSTPDAASPSAARDPAPRPGNLARLSHQKRDLIRGAGSALPAPTRQRYEQFFGADLSGVRIHHDSPSAAITDRIGARALTAGRDIAFARGQFAPGTGEGDRLLAHELTHVVQSGGGAHDVGPSAADLQANGGLTERDMELIRQWLQTEEQPAWGQGASGFEPMRPLDPQRMFPLGPRGLGTEGLRSSDPFAPDPMRAQAVGDICPNCHQTPDEQRAERARRRAEDEAQRRRREADEAARLRRASWHGMHGTQATTDLAQQAGTLSEDIETSRISLGQLRLRMFETALAAQSADTPAAGGAMGLTQEMRDALEDAQGTVGVLDGVLTAADAEMPPDLATPMRLVMARYFLALSDLFSERDREIAELEARLRQFRTPCPSCHDRLPPPGPAIDAPFRMPEPGIPGLPSFAMRQPEPAPDPELAAALARSGPRATRIAAAIRRNDDAETRASWRQVILDYHWSIGELDSILRDRLSTRPEGQEMVQQFEYTQGLLERQERFRLQHPRALKVQAVFYPKEDVVDQSDPETGRTRQAARAIPWHFYLTRTPDPNPTPGRVPAGYEWQLHDITAPRRGSNSEEDRSVRTRHQISMLEAHFRETGMAQDPRPIEEMDPPDRIWHELNHRDFFPEGVLYFNYPVAAGRGEIRQGHVTMTDDTPFGVWLQRIGMAIAIIGGLVFAPFSVPMLLAVGAGTALSIAGTVHRHAEMERHGVLTAADTRDMYWNISLDLINALTLGLGRVATVTARAGNLLRAAQATRYYFIARRVEIGMQGVNLVLVTSSIVQRYQAIQSSSMTPEQKQQAMRSLALEALLAGGLAFVMLRSAAHDLGPRARLRVDLDPSNPRTLVADIEPGIESATRAGGRTRPDATRVNRVTIRHAPTGETHELIIWSDGLFTRCSPPPCQLLAENIVGRLDELAESMLSVSRHQAAMQDLRTRARQLHQETEGLGDQTEAMRTRSAALMARGQELETMVGQLEQRVQRENEAAEVVGREEARARYGEAAMNYDRRYYRWLWDRETGRLVFQRRHQGVPWMRFEGGQFVVTRSLFVPVSAERLAEVRAGSVTNQPDFRIAGAPITTLEELRRLRPYSATLRRRPSDWVLVQINDDNLRYFLEEPVPHGAIFEFPNGARLWRTPQNTIATDGPIGAAIGRRGFEQTAPPQLRGTGDDSNLGVDVRGEAAGVEHQRAHPRGQGTGFELYNHIPLAPTYINQVLQARGIELYLSELHRLNPTLDLRFHTEHSVFPGTRRQAWIDYHVYMVQNGRPERMFTLRIGTDYSDPLRPGQVEFRNVTQRPEHVALLDTPDMRAAREALETRIREARARGRR